MNNKSKINLKDWNKIYLAVLTDKGAEDWRMEDDENMYMVISKNEKSARLLVNNIASEILLRSDYNKNTWLDNQYSNFFIIGITPIENDGVCFSTWEDYFDWEKLFGITTKYIYDHNISKLKNDLNKTFDKVFGNKDSKKESNIKDKKEKNIVKETR